MGTYTCNPLSARWCRRLRRQDVLKGRISAQGIFVLSSQPVTPFILPPPLLILILGMARHKSVCAWPNPPIRAQSSPPFLRNIVKRRGRLPYHASNKKKKRFEALFLKTYCYC